MRRAFIAGFIAAALTWATDTVGAERTFVYCSEGNPNALNPQFTTSGTSLTALRLVFETLVGQDPDDARPIPRLAKSWEMSDDGLVHTFHLREGVRFHSRGDFTPTRTMNADDVVFSIERQLRPDHPYHNVSGRPYQFFRGLAMNSLIRAVDKVDDLTVRLVLNRPEAPLLAELSMEFLSVMSAEYAAYQQSRGTPEAFDTEPVGTGPFVLESYQKDVAIRYHTFLDYWNGPRPIDNLIFAIMPNASIRSNQLKVGECHVIAYPNLDDLPKLRADPRLRVMEKRGDNVSYVVMNGGRRPFDDIRVRRAFAFAIDRAAIVEAVFGGAATLAENPLPVGLLGYNDAIPPLPHDPDQARRLLAEAGYSDGLEIDLFYMPVARPYMPQAKRAAEMIAADLREIGIRAKLGTEEWANYLRRDKEGLYYNAAIIGWSGDNTDPDNFLGLPLTCDGDRPRLDNLARWCDLEYNALIAEAKVVSNPERRAELYRRALEVFRDGLPWVPLAHSHVFAALRAEVRGFRMDRIGRYLLNDVSLDR